MDKEILVEKVISALKQAAYKEQKKFSLLMVSFGDGSTDEFFTLIVSAPWINGMTVKQAIMYLLDIIRKSLSADELQEFMGASNILAINTNDPLVRGVTAPFGGGGSVFIFAQQMIINDENLGRCIVYEANAQ